MSTLPHLLDELARQQKAGESPYREWQISPEIDYYLRQLAKRLKKPLEIRHLRVLPSNVSEEIIRRLRELEKQLLASRAELAALEFADDKPDNAPSEIGRRKLAQLIATMVLPLAEVTGAVDLDLTLTIGRNLPEPLPDSGLGVYATVESQNGGKPGMRTVLRRRFAAERNYARYQPATDIEIGLTLVCLPGRMAADQDNDDSNLKRFIGRDRDDNSIFNRGNELMQALQNQKDGNDRTSAADQETAQRALAALNTFLLIMWDEQKINAIDNARFAATGLAAIGVDSSNMPYEASLPPDAIPYIDEVMRALATLKEIPPMLAAGIQHFQEALAHTFSATEQHPHNYAALNHVDPGHNQSVHEQLPKEKDEKDFTDSNNDDIVDWKQPEAFAPISEILALAAEHLLATHEQKHNDGPTQPTTVRNNSVHPFNENPQPQDS